MWKWATNSSSGIYIYYVNVCVKQKDHDERESLLIFLTHNKVNDRYYLLCFTPPMNGEKNLSIKSTLPCVYMVSLVHCSNQVQCVCIFYIDKNTPTHTHTMCVVCGVCVCMGGCACGCALKLMTIRAPKPHDFLINRPQLNCCLSWVLP